MASSLHYWLGIFQKISGSGGHVSMVKGDRLLLELRWPVWLIQHTNIDSLSLFFKIVFMWTIFKVSVEFVEILLLSYVLVSWHVGSYLPDQGLNLNPLHWKVKS